MTKNELAEKIVLAMRAAGYRVDEGAGELNIVYVEGMSADGDPNRNEPNEFNDLRVVIRFTAGKPEIAGLWEATTEPSRRWTQNPMNPKGAARIAFGQYTAWQVGVHHNDHEALVQTAPVTVYRDYNRDYKREGDEQDTGLFGINQHWGYDLPHDDLGNSSAGCLVGRTRNGHRAFMAMVKTDPRYVADRRYRFTATIMPAGTVLSARPAQPPAAAPTAPRTAPRTAAKDGGVIAAVLAVVGGAVQWLADNPWLTAASLAVGLVAAAVLIGWWRSRH